MVGWMDGYKFEICIRELVYLFIAFINKDFTNVISVESDAGSTEPTQSKNFQI